MHPVFLTVEHANGWEVAASIAQVMAALAAAGGAIAAWRAAASSLTAQRDARQALARALQPDLVIYAGEKGIFVMNTSRSRAALSRIESEVSRNGASIATRSLAHLGHFAGLPNGIYLGNVTGAEDGVWRVSDDIDWEDSLVLTFSDANDLGRWRLRTLPSHQGLPSIGELEFVMELIQP